MDQVRTRWLFETSSLSKSYRAQERPTADESGHPSGHGVRFGEIRIPHGGVIALVGASGTGKTTLFNLLGGLDNPDQAPGAPSPHIWLDLGGGAIDIVAEPHRFARAQVGYIFQSGYLLKNVSAGLNIALPLAQQGRRAARAEIAARLQDLEIAPEELDERAWKFSGGEAQRIAFVRSMAHGPSLIFADEPTSNLDYDNAQKIMGQLRRWAHDPDHPGRTVLWITHDLRLAAAVADAVLMFHRDAPPLQQPVCLPGDTRSDRGLGAATLHRWAVDRRIMAAESPLPYLGSGGVEAARGGPARPRGTRAVRVSALVRVGLSEVFSRHCAQRDAKVRRCVNPVLSIPGTAQSPPRPWSALPAWIAAFGQWGAVIALLLITVLGTAGITIKRVVNEQLENTANDPRTCHVIVKEVKDHTLDEPDYGETALSRRPWAASKAPSGASSVAGSATEVPSTCRQGKAAYGRRDARGWGVALAEHGTCPGAASHYVRILTADTAEPIWTKVRLLAAPKIDAPTRLASYLEVQDGVSNDVIYLADDREHDLGAQRTGDLVDNTVCFYDDAWPRPIRLRIAGILDRNDVPTWERNQFDGLIPNYTYDAMRYAVNSARLVNGSTHIAVYFSVEDLSALDDYLKIHGYGFVKDNLNKIRDLIRKSATYGTLIAGFLVLIGLLSALLTALSIGNYLNANTQSFALLKAFGMSRRFMAGVLLVEITAGWVVASVLLAVAIAVVTTIVMILTGNQGLQLGDALLTGQVLWIPYLIADGAVWLLSAIVSVRMTWWWWHRNRYVAQALKTG